jgi:hypothetical protein
MIYYQSDNIFVSVATKMSRLDPDPTRFVIIGIPAPDPQTATMHAWINQDDANF